MKFYNHSIVTVCTYHEDNGYPVDQTEFLVRGLGRGRWIVEDENGYRRVLRTAALQRFFRSRRYVGDYHSSGEPIYAYEESWVRIY